MNKPHRRWSRWNPDIMGGPWEAVHRTTEAGAHGIRSEGFKPEYYGKGGGLGIGLEPLGTFVSRHAGEDFYKESEGYGYSTPPFGRVFKVKIPKGKILQTTHDELQARAQRYGIDFLKQRLGISDEVALGVFKSDYRLLQAAGYKELDDASAMIRKWQDWSSSFASASEGLTFQRYFARRLMDEGYVAVEWEDATHHKLQQTLVLDPGRMRIVEEVTKEPSAGRVLDLTSLGPSVSLYELVNNGLHAKKVLTYDDISGGKWHPGWGGIWDKLMKVVGVGWSSDRVAMMRWLRQQEILQAIRKAGYDGVRFIERGPQGEVPVVKFIGERASNPTGAEHSWVQKALTYFHDTDDPRRAGYMLTDGRLLDFGHLSIPGMYRTQDHNDIRFIVGRDVAESPVLFQQATGASRVTYSPRSNAWTADFYTRPTKAQGERLLEWADGRMFVVIDARRPGAERYHATIKNADVDDVRLLLRDLDNYFSGRPVRAAGGQLFNPVGWSGQLPDLHVIREYERMDDVADVRAWVGQARAMPSRAEGLLFLLSHLYVGPLDPEEFSAGWMLPDGGLYDAEEDPHEKMSSELGKVLGIRKLDRYGFMKLTRAIRMYLAAEGSVLVELATGPTPAQMSRIAKLTREAGDDLTFDIMTPSGLQSGKGIHAFREAVSFYYGYGRNPLKGLRRTYQALVLNPWQLKATSNPARRRLY